MKTLSAALALTLAAPACGLAAESGPPAKTITVTVGGGALLAPAFLGSKDYQLVAIPNIAVTYEDLLFASVEEGLGVNLVNRNGLRAGPIAKYAFAREEDGNNTLVIAGRKTDALRGLGDVDGTVELGGFAEYTLGQVTAHVELRQGVNGHEGLVGDISASYAQDIHTLFYPDGPPVILSLGAHTTLADSQYTGAYFGIDAQQSADSGLGTYKPDGGLLSYGLSASAFVPLTAKVSLAAMAGYDRLAADAGDSPLVRERGARDQFTAGLFLSYAFGY